MNKNKLKKSFVESIKMITMIFSIILFVTCAITGIMFLLDKLSFWLVCLIIFIAAILLLTIMFYLDS